MPGDSLPLSPELELLEEVEKVKEKVEEKVAEVEKSLPFSYSGIKKRETYVNKYVTPGTMARRVDNLNLQELC